MREGIGKKNHMTITVKLTDGSVVTGELVKKDRKPAAKTLTYQLADKCPLSFKGKQRQTVRDILSTDTKKFWNVDEIAKIAATKGYTANAGVAPSVAWHLHQLHLLGHVVTQ